MFQTAIQLYSLSIKASQILLKRNEYNGVQVLYYDICYLVGVAWWSEIVWVNQPDSIVITKQVLVLISLTLALIID